MPGAGYSDESDIMDHISSRPAVAAGGARREGGVSSRSRRPGDSVRIRTNIDKPRKPDISNLITDGPSRSHSPRCSRACPCQERRRPPGSRAALEVRRRPRRADGGARRVGPDRSGDRIRAAHAAVRSRDCGSGRGPSQTSPVSAGQPRIGGAAARAAFAPGRGRPHDNIEASLYFPSQRTVRQQPCPRSESTCSTARLSGRSVR